MYWSGTGRTTQWKLVLFTNSYRCNILPGSIMMPFNNPKMPSTAIPNNLNGSVSIQNKGYSTKAKIATGQQKIKRMIQAIKVIID
ncbi:MAG: hypothetical protein H7Y07_05700 [Pyrinomonadaceae bacterium]|nr:hypothetical protein [Sphingobacteriaceae bacterium]